MPLHDRTKVDERASVLLTTWRKTVAHACAFSRDSLLASYALALTPRLKKTTAAARKDCLVTNWQG